MEREIVVQHEYYLSFGYTHYSAVADILCLQVLSK